MFSLMIAQQGTEAAEPAASKAQAALAEPGMVEATMQDLGIDKYVESVSPLLTEYGVRAAGAIVFLLVAFWFARWASRFTTRALQKAKVEITLTAFLAKIVRILVMLLAVVTCLGIFGVPSTMFATALGTAGLAIGLALQGSLSNVSAGAMLAIFRPFKITDVVVLNGQLGTVMEIDLFATRLNTLDNRRIIIPNNQVFGTVIENITHNPIRRADIDVGVEYSADIDATRAVLEKAALAVPGRVQDPAPMIVNTGFGDSSVNWQVSVWAPTPDFIIVRQATIRQVKMALDAAKIGIPFPQRVVHFRNEGPSVRVKMAGDPTV